MRSEGSSAFTRAVVRTPHPTDSTLTIVVAAGGAYEGVLWTKIYLRAPFTTDHW